jgi:hypothetical protein
MHDALEQEVESVGKVHEVVDVGRVEAVLAEAVFRDRLVLVVVVIAGNAHHKRLKVQVARLVGEDALCVGVRKLYALLLLGSHSTKRRERPTIRKDSSEVAPLFRRITVRIGCDAVHGLARR